MTLVNNKEVHFFFVCCSDGYSSGDVIGFFISLPENSRHPGKKKCLHSVFVFVISFLSFFKSWFLWGSLCHKQTHNHQWRYFVSWKVLFRGSPVFNGPTVIVLPRLAHSRVKMGFNKLDYNQSSLALLCQAWRLILTSLHFQRK